MRPIKLFLPLILATLPALAADPPDVINYQGVLRNALDEPQTGPFAMTFRLFDDPATGTEILCDSHTVLVSNGLFSTTLGEATNITACMGAGNEVPLIEAFAGHTDLYLQVEVGAEILLPRIRVAASGYALNTRLVRGREIVAPGPLDLYVDAATGDDAQDGLSPATAKQTIQAAISDIPAVLDGDVEVHIASGTYNERVAITSRVRTAGVQWIRLTGDPLNPLNVVIDGTALPPPANDGPESGVWVQDLPVEISGLTVRNFDRDGVAGELGTFLIVNDCRLETNGESGLRAGEGGKIELADTVITGNVTGMSAENSGTIRIGDGVHITDNTNLGVQANHGGTVKFGSSNDCSLVNNDLAVSDHSSALGYGVCTLTSSTCTAGDTSARCVP